MRGVFSTGVLDEFLANDFNPFDFYIGVSSGASNTAAYLAQMIGRNHKIFLDYSLRPEFINFYRFIRGGHLLDLDWLWDITIREIRLDLKTIYSKKKLFYVVMTDIRTGNAVYHPTSADDLEQALKASSAAPPLYRGFPKVNGRPMADGGIAEALPVREAIELGADRLMVIRSRPRRYRKRRELSDHILRWWFRDYPRLRDTVAERAERYNQALSFIRNPPAGISFVEVCPPDDFSVSRLTRDPIALQKGYEQGRALGREAISFWKEGRRGLVTGSETR